MNFISTRAALLGKRTSLQCFKQALSAFNYKILEKKYQYEKNIISNTQNKLSEDELISYFRIDTSDLTDDEITEVREELEKYTDMLKLAIKNKRDKK